MSTRSYIGMVYPGSKKVKYIYCHFDGYPSGVGATLVANYNQMYYVDCLLDLGDISGLDMHLPTSNLLNIFTRKHITEQDREDILRATHTTVSYRDWRKEDCPAQEMTYDEYLNYRDKEDGIEFFYLFDPLTNKWSCYDIYHHKEIDLY